jgi:hypothetical protein
MGRGAIGESAPRLAAIRKGWLAAHCVGQPRRSRLEVGTRSRDSLRGSKGGTCGRE